MTRVHHTRPQQQQGASRVMALDKTRAAVKKKKPYKIVLEAVTQEKKKLHSILTYASNAPQGFGFVPAGHPEITEWCKEQCRQRNLDVHVVSAKPKNKTHADPQKLSHHVHRIGHHFPLEIIKLACSKFGYDYDEESGLRKARVRDRENWIEQQVESYSTRQALHGAPAAEEGSKDHISGAVREMFPKIPEADLSSIVNHAFEEGTNRVGNATELPLARRVQLAVVAHIRHTYTDYDKMLKTGSWSEARQKVEHVSLAKLKEWRDETGEQSNEIEDTFREVIVLDDDDDDGTSDGGNTPNEREQSMEIVSNRVMARDIQLERYPQYPLANDHQRRRVHRGRGHRETIFVHPYPPPSAVQELSAVHTGRAHDQLRPVPFPDIHSQTPNDMQPRHAPAQPESRRAPNYMRDSDGRLYELLPIDDIPRVKYEPPYRTAAPHHVQQSYSHSSPRIDAQPSRAPPPPPRRTSDHEVVLPSVEREAVDLTSPPRTVNDQRPVQGRNGAHQEYSHVQALKRTAHPPISQSNDRCLEQPSKRSRASLHEQELYTGSNSRQAAMQPRSRGYQPSETRPRHQVHPSQEVIDLTSSSRQAPLGTAGDFYARGQSDYVYMHEVQRRPAARNDYQDQSAGARSHAYVPEHDRMYQRRPPPAHEYIPLKR